MKNRHKIHYILMIKKMPKSILFFIVKNRHKI